MKFLDRGTIRKAVTDAMSGFLRAPATLTRSGVFQYFVDSNGDFLFGPDASQPGAKLIGVLRPPEEVFSDASMASFELVPVVDDHPYNEPDVKVTTENVRRLTVGSVGAPHRNGDLLEATVCITDADTIEKIKAGKVSLSCGYFADTIDAPAGAMFEGVAYHKIQKNVRGNHLAICDQGRAGEVARLHLDSVVQVEETLSDDSLAAKKLQQNTPSKKEQGKKNMDKIIVDGLPIEVSEIAAAAINKHNKATGEILAANATEIAALKSKADKTQAICDATAGEVTALKAEVAKLSAPAFIAAKIAERVEVEKLASKHGLVADGKDLITVKREVIAKLNPSIKLDGKSNDYVEAFYDASTAAPAGNAVTDAADKLLRESGAPTVAAITDADTRRKNFNTSVYGADATVVTNRMVPA